MDETPDACIATLRPVWLRVDLSGTAEEARERASYTYIQGAGDDEENWSRGLTAQLWWRWHSELIEMGRHDARAAEDETQAALRGVDALLCALALCSAKATALRGIVGQQTHLASLGTLRVVRREAGRNFITTSSLETR